VLKQLTTGSINNCKHAPEESSHSCVIENDATADSGANRVNKIEPLHSLDLYYLN